MAYDEQVRVQGNPIPAEHKPATEGRTDLREMYTVAEGVQLRNDGQRQSRDPVPAGSTGHGSKRLCRFGGNDTPAPVGIEELLSVFLKKYDYINVTSFGDYSFVWRPLTRREYQLINSFPIEDLHIAVCRTVVVWPEQVDYDTLPCGIVEQLGNGIIEESGFGSQEYIDTMLTRSRNSMELFERQAECAISATFPYISFEEMQDWPVVKLIDYLARAEWTMQNIHKVPLEFVKQQSETPPPTAEELRKAGIDPMSVLDPAAFRPSFIDFPIIHGTEQWRSFNAVLPGSRRGKAEAPEVPEK
jgi:hypothetical protein